MTHQPAALDSAERSEQAFLLAGTAVISSDPAESVDDVQAQLTPRLGQPLL
jgi:hypothetical protein